ncbi:MAG: DUF6644 family protein [Steroidobacteraceae bacterium]|jgi:hypothetical protein
MMLTIPEFLERIKVLPLSVAIHRGEWLFPIIEIVHVCALSLVVGSILMMDLRLLGLASRHNAVSRLSSEMLPWTWTAFALAALSGSLLFMSRAEVYWFNVQFRCKFALIVLAGINMLVFHLGIYRRVAGWDNQLPPPKAARAAGGLSILLWIGVVFFGRWIGFATN